MSGYLDVKYPFKTNLGLNPFKSWKRQWCILRPSPTCAGGGSLAVYSSEAGTASGSVELPSGSIVRRTKSRTRPNAFAVFSTTEPHKPRVLLAAQTSQETQQWMEKLKELIEGNKLLGTESLLKDTFSVTIMSTDLSRKCGLSADGTISVSSKGMTVKQAGNVARFVDWKHIGDITLSRKSDLCCVVVDSSFPRGCGELKLSCPLVGDMVAALQQARSHDARKLSKSDGDLRVDRESGEVRRSSWYSGPSDVSLDDIDLVMSKDTSHIPGGQLSRCAGAGELAASRARLHSLPCDDSMSDRRSLLSVASGIYEEIPDLPLPKPKDDLYCPMGQDTVDGPIKKNYSPIEKQKETIYCPMRKDGSAMGLYLPMDKEKCPKSNEGISSSVYCPMGDQNLSPNTLYCPMDKKLSSGYCAMDKKLPSAYSPLGEKLTSGYCPMGEKLTTGYCPMGEKLTSGYCPMGEKLSNINCLGENVIDEPTYESVADCVYATMRRSGKKFPPPLPPRLPFGECKPRVTRHESLCSLPRDRSRTHTLPARDTLSGFSVFRKRLKSDSRIMDSPKSDKSKENKDVETKKKKFDFTPTRDLFKSFKVGRKMKNLKITSTNLVKNEAKSCEFLDEANHVPVNPNRCSKSVECLENVKFDDFDRDLSIDLQDDVVATLALPQEILDLIIRGRDQLNKLKDTPESEYIPMSPINAIIPPPPIEQHYMVMSPRANIA